MAGFGWKLHGDGKSLAPGEVVRPDERLTWGPTAGLGAQHVVSMIGACFVAPILMGLDANLAVMASGVATILFLLITRGRIPSYLGSSMAKLGGSSNREMPVRVESSPDNDGTRWHGLCNTGSARTRPRSLWLPPLGATR